MCNFDWVWNTITLNHMLDFLKTALKCEKEVNWAFGTASSSDPGPLSSHCRGRLQLGALNQKLQHRPKCGPILANQSYNSFHVKIGHMPIALWRPTPSRRTQQIQYRPKCGLLLAHQSVKRPIALISVCVQGSKS